MSQKKSTSRTNDQKSPVKKGQHISSKHGRGRRGKSEPAVESSPGQLYNRRRWMSDERQKETRESTDHREKKKALSGSQYDTTFKGSALKNDAPGSAPITARDLLNEFVNDDFIDQASDWKSDALGIQTETPPSTEQPDKAKKRKKKKRNKKSPSDQRRSVLRHHKNPFLVDDDAIIRVYDNNVEGDDEQESSPSDHDVKRRRSRERKKTERSCTRRGREQSSSSTDEEENFVKTLPPPAPKHEPQTNPLLQANTGLRNIPQEYRKRAAALRTHSPTDYMLHGFSNASMRVFEFATENSRPVIPWNYRADKGPHKWGQMFPYQCAGSMQSPIAIQTINTKRKEWAPLELNGYGDTDGKRMTLTNLGTTVELMLEGNYTIRGGGLGGTYVADQVHFHWGFSNEQGSEHVLDRRKYPAEMHIVHHEQSLIGDSIFHTPGGVAAIGIFIEIGEKNEAFEKLVKHLKQIKFKDESQLVTEPIRLTDLFPENRSQFYRYIGSLTTPPCYEVVTWTVLKQPITISREQMSALRGVFETTRHAYVYRTETPILLQNNFRPAQRINGRDVYRCGF